MALVSAKALYNTGDYRGATNRAYYAAYQAATFVGSFFVERENKMDLGMLNGKLRTTPSAQAAADLVRPYTKGAFSDGITLTVADKRVYEIHGYWQVPLVPSHWPERTLPIHEDLAIMEEKLRDQGVNDIILALGEKL